jgi:hypothetical protein
MLIWGWISTKPEYGVSISALLFSLDHEGASLDVDIYGWFGALTDWLQAYTLQVLVPQATEMVQRSRQVRAWRLVESSSSEVT